MWLCCIRVASGEAIKHIFRTLHWACNAVVQTTIHFIEYTHETREPSDGNEKKNGRPAYEVLGELLFIIINYLFFECYYSFKEKHCGIFSADFDFQSNWLKYRFFFYLHVCSKRSAQNNTLRVWKISTTFKMADTRAQTNALCMSGVLSEVISALWWFDN